MRRRKKPAVISLFTGAMGLDLGLEKAGFKTRVVVEIDRRALNTIKVNRPNIPRIEKSIVEVSTDEILKEAGLKVGEAALVIGGPSCQSFSTAGHRKSVKDPRGSLFKEFIRVVKEARPRFFIMENVRGMLSAAIKHRPLKRRGPGFPVLKPEERLGSAFALLLRELKKTGYHIVYDLLNAADYGTPQIRHRVIIIGSRDGEALRMPTATHAEKGKGKRKTWVTLREALRGAKSHPDQRYCRIPKKWKKYLKYVPAGGCWTSIPKRRQRWAMGKAYKSWGGRKGFYRRLAWNLPAPSLTTEPASKATMICHPTELRPLSVAEYCRIQEFPDNWMFSGELSTIYRQIGNAVPVGLGKAVGNSIKALMKRKRSDKRRLKMVRCASKDLAYRLEHRDRLTVLNPTRMRTQKSLASARKWMLASRGKAITRRKRKKLAS